MKVNVSYFGQLRDLAGQDAEVCEPDASSDLRTLLTDLADRHGGPFRNAMLDETGGLRRSLLLSVNGAAVVKTALPPLNDGDEITLMSPIAGG